MNRTRVTSRAKDQQRSRCGKKNSLSSAVELCLKFKTSSIYDGCNITAIEQVLAGKDWGKLICLAVSYARMTLKTDEFRSVCATLQAVVATEYVQHDESVKSSLEQILTAFNAFGHTVTTPTHPSLSDVIDEVYLLSKDDLSLGVESSQRKYRDKRTRFRNWISSAIAAEILSVVTPADDPRTYHNCDAKYTMRHKLIVDTLSKRIAASIERASAPESRINCSFRTSGEELFTSLPGPAAPPLPFGFIATSVPDLARTPTPTHCPALLDGDPFHVDNYMIHDLPSPSSSSSFYAHAIAPQEYHSRPQSLTFADDSAEFLMNQAVMRKIEPSFDFGYNMFA
ncbi:hypothetical protein J8273_1440 [Carpediemonas membranifera]|uniref:Uncharacterized protein n=1 Tax=Carpediemonas membranifera TaxID=201153 RepID=A0A8J6EB75_9EUKA|nr:hypothetical protein J8273_1440 [Carpediemonas membranifera]|eukprot:KAG9396460.1 hypothetical protein J8273_1440 [Carpediemonas membranifera]